MCYFSFLLFWTLCTILKIDYQILNCYCLSGWCTKSKGCFGVSSWCDAGNGILNILSFFKGEFLISSVCFFILIVSLDVQCLRENHISIIYFSDFCLIIGICVWSNTLIVSVISHIVSRQLKLFFRYKYSLNFFFGTNIKFNYYHLVDRNFSIHTTYYCLGY